jgi:uncharacterized membrane protein YgcG
MRSSRFAAFLVAIGLLLLWAAPAAAATDAASFEAAAAADEAVTGFDSTIAVKADGSLAITETIQYGFGSNDRHGIFRNVPTREIADASHDRLFPVDDVSVTMDGSDVPTSLSTQGADEVIKIGDPNRTITGKHTYRISYTVRGATNTFPDHDELYWNAVGTGWTVPVDGITVTVTGPAPVQRTACFAGPASSHLSCASQAYAGSKATFAEPGLGPGQALSVVVAFPKGSVAGAGPILVPHQVTNWFNPTPVTIAVGAVLALLGVGVALLIGWRVGRDRVYLGQLPGLTPEPGEPAEQKRKPLWHPPPVSVEFTPPHNVRPGQVGTLIDERANVVDVTATIIDFAVRRQLRIRELPEAKPHDWELTKLTDGDTAFRPYERKLFSALFAKGDVVRLSELKNTFASQLRAVQSALYAEMVAQGWYRASPRQTRTVARAAAWLSLLGSIGLTLLLGLTVHAGLVGLGLVVASLCLIFVAEATPARTGTGSAMLARLMGFRLFIATAQADQIKFEERVQIFSDYLPYAMVYGLADRWAGILADLAREHPDAAPTTLYWYTGAGAFDVTHFNHSISTFTAVANGTLVSTPASTGASGFSGGGFSGGGGGGGGGGSW